MDQRLQDDDAAVVEALLRRRHSARAFLAEGVPEPTIHRMFTMSQLTASWCNVQPWQIVLLSGDAAIEFGAALTGHARDNEPNPDFGRPLAYTGVYRDRRRQSGFALYESRSIAREDHRARTAQALRNYSFFGAPHVAIITTEADLGVYGAVDCGGYIATLLLAAESLGISAIAQGALSMYPDFIRDRLGLPENRLVVAGVSFGYEDPNDLINAYRIPREPIESVVTRFGAA